jgi:chemotaxis protein methyltransferase CheR
MNVETAFAEAMPGISPGVYGPHDFRAVAEMVHADSGILLPQGKAMLVYSRLAPLVRESGLGTFSAYIATLEKDRAERDRVIAALTTNHTFFYREAHHFEHFERMVRDSLVRNLDRGGAVRMWSAGCSSGEETWSLMMTLLGGDRLGGRRIVSKNLRVLASDIAPHALAKAEAAIYATEELKPVPTDLRELWSKDEAGLSTIAPEARGVVRFRRLNLQEAWPMKGRFDVIFCRNVMIYFDNPTKERLISRFAEALAPGAHLYIGHSERVTGPAAKLLEPVGPTIYRRRAA